MAIQSAPLQARPFHQSYGRRSQPKEDPSCPPTPRHLVQPPQGRVRASLSETAHDRADPPTALARPAAPRLNASRLPANSYRDRGYRAEMQRFALASLHPAVRKSDQHSYPARQVDGYFDSPMEQKVT